MTQQRDPELVDRARTVLERLEFALTQFHALRDELSRNLESYVQFDTPIATDEVRLRAMLLLAENQLSLSPASHEQEDYSIAGEVSAATSDGFKFLVDGQWKSHEFSRVLSATEQIYKLMAVRHVGLQRLRRSPLTSDTRRDVYDNARLHYFLDSREDLQIMKRGQANNT